MTLQPPNGLPLNAVAWDVEALRTLLVDMLMRCKIGTVDLMRVWMGKVNKASDGLLKDEFVSAIHDMFFSSHKALWEEEVQPVVERSFDAVTKLLKGQKFLRRVTVVHLERWLGSGLQATGFRETVPIKRQHRRLADPTGNSIASEGARHRSTPRPVSLPPSPRSSITLPRYGPAQVLPNGSPRTPAGQQAASSPRVVTSSAHYDRLRSRGMRRWRTRIQSTKGDLQTQMSMRLQTKGVNLTEAERQRFGDDGYVLWTMMRPRAARPPR